MTSTPHIGVIGAGAFGGWSALMLRRAGCRVTLCDAWGPGNNRSSSGGETRIIRRAYDRARFVRMADRSLALWREFCADQSAASLHTTGVLYLASATQGDRFIGTAADLLSDAGATFEPLDVSRLTDQYPAIDARDLLAARFEPDAGYLMARRACRHVVSALIAEGGRYVPMAARPGDLRGGALTEVRLSNGDRLAADLFVFACGPWLAALFPETLGALLRVTRQEVCFFGTPPGDDRFAPPQLPVWADFGESLWYGIPGAAGRGFKLAHDARGPSMDPTGDDRVISESALDSARRYLARRFPALADAPLLESRVCQYTDTATADFLIDHHPEADNLWFVGGGSGHGFKHGPAVGEIAMRALVHGEAPDAVHSIGALTSQT